MESDRPGTTSDAGIIVVPANEASCDDLRALFGARGAASRCRCQRFTFRGRAWYLERGSVPLEERADRLREQTHCGQPEARTTSGLAACLGSEPVGWCAVDPRTAYVRLLRKRTVRAGRAEDKSDEVWAVTCFVTHTGFRRRGVSRSIFAAAGFTEVSRPTLRRGVMRIDC